VQGNYRTAITIPDKSWGRLRDIIDDFCEKMENSEVLERTVLRIHGSGSADPCI
jgi:hypothetical protein